MINYSKKACTIFKGLHPINADNILMMPASKLRSLSFSPAEQYEKFELLESAIKLISVFKHYIKCFTKNRNDSNRNYLSITCTLVQAMHV